MRSLRMLLRALDTPEGPQPRIRNPFVSMLACSGVEWPVVLSYWVFQALAEPSVLGYLAFQSPELAKVLK